MTFIALRVDFEGFGVAEPFPKKDMRLFCFILSGCGLDLGAIVRIWWYARGRRRWSLCNVDFLFFKFVLPPDRLFQCLAAAAEANFPTQPRLYGPRVLWRHLLLPATISRLQQLQVQRSASLKLSKYTCLSPVNTSQSI